MPMTATYGMLMDGQQIPAQREETIEVRNPANTDEIVGVVPKGASEDVERAVTSAQKAFETTWWPRLHESRRRGRVLQKFVALVEARKEDLARLLTREQGKVYREAQSEIESLTSSFDYYAGYGGKITGTVTYARDGDNVLKLETRKQPIGVCAAILPLNFPVSLYAWKVAPALMAANAAIINPATTAPLTDIVLTQMLHEARVPAGLAHRRPRPSPARRDTLIRHPAVRESSLTRPTGTSPTI